MERRRSVRILGDSSDAMKYFRFGGIVAKEQGRITRPSSGDRQFVAPLKTQTSSDSFGFEMDPQTAARYWSPN